MADISSFPSVCDDSHFFAKGLNRLFGAFFLAFLCGGGFVAISLFNVSRVALHHGSAIQSFPVDAVIPFVPGWVWVYLLYYPFCFLPLLLKEVRDDPETFSKTVTAFGLQFGVCFIIFLLWPLRMVHPGLTAGFNDGILKRLYAFDLGFNSFPSLHLANIVFVSFLFLRLRGPRWGTAVFGIAALIAISTVLVKQHFVSDVIVGAFLGWGSFAFSERFVFTRRGLYER